jgi:uncharacterized peroxidase-related enzyme
VKENSTACEKGIDMSWIRTIPRGQATGELKVEYEAAIQRAGKLFNILKVQSLNPASLRASMQLYLASMYGRSGLSRAEREMLATVVSGANQCFY